MGLAGLLVVAHLLDPAYRAAWFPLVTLLAAAFLAGLSGLAGVYLLARGEERYLLAVHAGAAAFYLAVAAGAIPYWSCDGAAVTTLLASGLTCALLVARLWG
jgi:O-antigen/teichoic acid export membrane protein